MKRGTGRLKQKLKQFRSMRISLFLLLITVAGLALAGVTAGTLLVYRQQLLSGRTGELQEYAYALSNRISASGFPSGKYF